MTQDTKMNWIFSGKSHAGSYPCWRCPTGDGFNDTYPLLTISEVAEYSKQYQVLVHGKSPTFADKNQKPFYNCVRSPLQVVSTHPEKQTIEVMTPTSPHMKL